MQCNSDEKLLDRAEVEERFGISKRFLEQAMVSGTGPPAIRVGRLVRYLPQDVRDWIMACRMPSGEPRR